MSAIYAKELDLDHIRRVAPAVFTDRPKDTTTNKYLFIPTSKILDGLLKNGFNVVSAKQQGSRKENGESYAKHVLHLIHDSQKQDLKAGGEYPLLRIQNSHDAKSSFQLSTGIFRLVCSNGIVLPESEFNSARIIHNQNTDRDTIEASFKVIENHGKELEFINQLKQIELNTDEKFLFADSAKRLLFDEETIELNERNRVDLRSEILQPRRYEDKSNDLWTVFNTIQENAIKGGVRILRPSKRGWKRDSANPEVSIGYRRTRAVNGIDADKRINIELMTLTQEFAKLKSA